VENDGVTITVDGDTSGLNQSIRATENLIQNLRKSLRSGSEALSDYGSAASSAAKDLDRFSSGAIKATSDVQSFGSQTLSSGTRSLIQFAVAASDAASDVTDLNSSINKVNTTGLADVSSKSSDASAQTSVFREKLNSTALSLATVGFEAAKAGAAIVASMVGQSIEAIDAQAQLAQQLGTTSASMAALERAGTNTGISTDQISSAAENLRNSLGQAALGSGDAAGALQRLGLSATELSNLPLDQKIAKINAAINSNIPASQQQPSSLAKKMDELSES